MYAHPAGKLRKFTPTVFSFFILHALKYKLKITAVVHGRDTCRIAGCPEG